MTLTANQIRDLIVQLLAGATGKPERHWQTVLGKVECLPLAFHAAGNWRVYPKGSDEDLAAVWKAVEIVRQEHRYAAP